MNFCPGTKNSINGKTTRYDRIINELCHIYSFIDNKKCVITLVLYIGSLPNLAT
jgi:hypothetical protein